MLWSCSGGVVDAIVTKRPTKILPLMALCKSIFCSTFYPLEQKLSVDSNESVHIFLAVLEEKELNRVQYNIFGSWDIQTPIPSKQ